ncbi:MAG: metal-sulfur cluster assembly factor [Nanoarchaeota archaeon]|nr:metal-sulfur cluster assembly factor [Nanoarchaeota archaeon]
MASMNQVIEAIKLCLDPEIKIDVWTLELIYGIDLTTAGTVSVKMTFTTPSCPYGPQLIQDVHDKIKVLEGVAHVVIDVVFDPPWQPSDDLKTMMGMTSGV